MKQILVGVLAVATCLSQQEGPARAQSNEELRKVGDILSKRLEGAASAGTNQTPSANTAPAEGQRRAPAPRRKRRRTGRARRSG
jgi:hypothetical protein